VATLAVLVAVSVAGASGDIYRWVDENGQVHYSNAPSRMQSREEPVLVPVPSGAPPASEGLPPEEGGGETGFGGVEGGEEAVMPPPDTAVSDTVAPNGAPVGGVPSDASAPGTAAQAALARMSLESEYRQARGHLTDIDRELDYLAAERTRFAKEGPESVGGLATVDSPDVRSEAEVALEKEREAIVARLDDIRGRYATLRGQVAAQRGGKAPAGWRELP
jgi:hypothetical protein